MATLDESSIPHSKKFKVYLPCPLAHPGLCASRDANIFSQCKATAAAMYHVLKLTATASFWRLSVIGEGDYHCTSWFCLESTRYRNPEINLLSTCTLWAPDHVSKDDPAEGYCSCMALSLVAAALRAMPDPSDLTCVLLSPAAKDFDRELVHADEVYLLEDWEAEMKKTALQVYPPRARVNPEVAEEETKSVLPEYLRRGLEATLVVLPLFVRICVY